MGAGGFGGEMVGVAIMVSVRACGGADEVGDGGGFGEVAPVFPWHFGCHGADLEAGGVEDAAVIGAPVLLHAVIVRDVGFLRAGGEDEVLAVPVGAAVGGEDRPGHGGEAADEEGGVGFDDVVVGFEPGDVAGAFGFRDFAEADEGAHFVGVAADGLGEVLDALDFGVGGAFEQVFLAGVGAKD